MGSPQALDARLADGVASSGVLVVGGDISDAGVEADGVVVAAGASQLGLESGRVADLFELADGTVIKARRLEAPRNVRWEIHIRPDSNADVTIALPPSSGCDAKGAICTEDGRMLSSRLEATIAGPGA